MGYLDNSSITVDAVLTKKGREILKDGGNLNITSFTLSDTGVDYTLWNTDHPIHSILLLVVQTPLDLMLLIYFLNYTLHEH